MEYIGTITATTTAKNNTDTATPFTIEQGSRILIQPDASCFVALVAATGTAVTTATGLQLEAAQPYEIPVGARLRYLSVITASGTANVKVFRLYVNG